MSKFNLKLGSYNQIYMNANVEKVKIFNFLHPLKL